MATKKINVKYLLKRLSKKDKKKQLAMLQKSRKLYKLNKFFTRKPVKSYKSKPSTFVKKASTFYNVQSIGATKELAKKSGCTIQSLEKIIRKGQGAYYSSGSRPNQTPQSWAIARLASALTNGKAGAVDYDILIKGCKKGSKGYNSAKKARKTFGKSYRKVPKINI